MNWPLSSRRSFLRTCLAGGTGLLATRACPPLFAVPESPSLPFQFFRAEGPALLDHSGHPAVLRGIAFGNRVWSGTRIPADHHDERDFARVAAMGMNLVRFYLHAHTLESDEHPFTYLDDGWAWIDRNVAWARRHGVYLVLNFHVPPGGFQSLGKGGALWEERPLQLRLISLWRAVAQRYAEEPVVAGYDLVNEPGVTRSVSQWRNLAQEIAQAIREVDRRHPLIVERVNSIAGRWTSNRDQNFVRIDDPNVVYTFHFYEPFRYTHQGAEWVDFLKGKDGGHWPDAKARHTRAALERALQPYLDWRNREQVPLYLGEFGCIRRCFEGARGGLAWVSDLLDLCEAHALPFTYHVYHENHFGLYFGEETIDPARANQPLIDLFTEKLTLRSRSDPVRPGSA